MKIGIEFEKLEMIYIIPLFAYSWWSNTHRLVIGWFCFRITISCPMKKKSIRVTENMRRCAREYLKKDLLKKMWRGKD